MVAGLAGVQGVDNALQTMAGKLFSFPSQLKDFPSRPKG